MVVALRGCAPVGRQLRPVRRLEEERKFRMSPGLSLTAVDEQVPRLELDMMKVCVMLEGERLPPHATLRWGGAASRNYRKLCFRPRGNYLWQGLWWVGGGV